MDEIDEGGYKVPPKKQGAERASLVPAPKKIEGYFDPNQVHVYNFPTKKIAKREPSNRGLLALALAVASILLSLTLITLLEPFYGFVSGLAPEIKLGMVALTLLFAAISSFTVSLILSITAIKKKLGRHFAITALALSGANILAATPSVLLLGQMLKLF